MSKLKIGEKAIDFNLPGTDGKSYSLGGFKDRRLLAVVFSCVHCPYVLAWEDRLVELQAEYAGRSVAFVLINSNNAEKYPADSFDNMKRHAAEKKYNFPFLHDESQVIARDFGAERTPEVFLFDSGRKLVYTGTIDDNYEDPGAVEKSYLRDAIEAALAGREAPIAVIPPVGCTIKWKP